MARTSKIVKCVDCGKEYPRKELNRHYRCRGCGMPAALDNINQLHNRSGPYYKKWRRSLKEAAAEL